MFTAFLYHLRARGVTVSTTEWVTLMDALVRGFSRSDLASFYHLAQSVLVKKESLFDAYDVAFSSFFQGVEDDFDLDDELLKWLSDPILPEPTDANLRLDFDELDMEALREAFEDRLREQDERHDGGNKWVGTGGTSPFGNAGKRPGGVRVGGSGGGRSAVQVAMQRRYRNLRADRVLDTRQIGVALRRLKRLGQIRGPEELDIDATIDASARNAGEIEMVFAPPRANRVKLLLLMDVGGSMDPHAELCERLFSAAHKATHFKAFESHFFHNCVYDQLYDDIHQYEGPLTSDVLKQLDATWTVIIVGDAYMHPYELTMEGGAIYYGDRDGMSGLSWLTRIREKCPNSVWLNPEPKRIWLAPSVRIVRRVFPMFQLTLEGLDEAINMLRGARANKPDPR